MPGNEAEEILALSLIFVVHVAGGLMLVWGMLEGNARPRPWRRWRRGRGPDGPPSDPPPPPARATRAPLPMPAASPSRVRLRDETPLREGYEPPARRPQRTPARTPSRR